jgi:hypothetical protein
MRGTVSTASIFETQNTGKHVTGRRMWQRCGLAIAMSDGAGDRQTRT